MIARQWRNGSAHLLRLGDEIVTTKSSRFLVQSTACVGSQSLFWLNPATRSVTHVIRGPATVWGVVDVVPYGRPLT